MDDYERSWVVMEARVGGRLCWAWGLLGVGPGFEEMSYTEVGGMEAADIASVPEVTRFLFTAPAPR